MQKWLLGLLAGLFWMSTSWGQENQQIYIKVGDAKVKRSLIAVPAFQFFGTPAMAPNYRAIGTEIFNTFLNDLDVTAYFEFIKASAFLEDPSQVGLKPAPGEANGFKFENWKKIGTEFLVRAGYKIQNGKVTLEGYVYSVPLGKLIRGKEYVADVNDARRLAHTFANDLIEGITGKSGFFLSKLVFASDKGGKGWKEIYVSDWDGNDMKKVSDHRSIALSPTWSPDGKSVSYTAFAYHPKAKTRNADLFTYEVQTGKRFLLSSRTGINSGAAYSPDGKHIYFTLTQNGNSDIYRIDTEGEDLTQVTKGPAGALNVEPVISPDGKRIAFSSNRAGQPMIYVMDLDGKNTKRLTFAGRYNSTPSWSPDSKRLLFAGWDKDHFDVFVMDADGTNMERLTTAPKVNGKASNNEEPVFSSDGRNVIFTSDRTGNKQIYIMNVDGSNERRITVDKHNYFKPKWLWKQD